MVALLLDKTMDEDVTGMFNVHCYEKDEERET